MNSDSLLFSYLRLSAFICGQLIFWGTAIHAQVQPGEIRAIFSQSVEAILFEYPSKAAAVHEKKC